MTLLIFSISSSITFKVIKLVIKSSYIAKSYISCFVKSEKSETFAKSVKSSFFSHTQLSLLTHSYFSK